MASVFDCFLLYETNERFYFDPCTIDKLPVEQNNHCLVIDRFSGEVSLFPRSTLPYTTVNRLVYGIFGTIELITCKHIVIITSRELVTTMNNEPIYCIKSTEILPYVITNLISKSAKEIGENQIYYQMLQTFIDFRYFYFSPTYDLTHTLQNLQSTDAEFRRRSLFHRADQRFVWNQYLLKDFSSIEKIDRFIFPIMLGFVKSIQSCSINGRQFKLTLISRRNVRRVGVRLYSRGLDQEGNVSNFVELEQILEFGQYLCSLVQIRGSIPMFWSQKPNLERLPHPKLRMDADHDTAFRRHLNNQLQLYNDRLCILSLISKSGRELKLFDAFQHLCSSANVDDRIKFIAFDFHRQCKALDWSKLSELINNIEPIIRDYKYFSLNKTDEMEPEISRQTGTFRTNCIDCLDRTNVVQSLIANKSLEIQLKQLKVLSQDDLLIRYKDFILDFNNLWADNGDFLSIHYAGTAALKSDFTRTGTRTKLGMLNDGLNTGKRYLINNFIDGFRQDALDFGLGNFIIDQSVSTSRAVTLNEWEWRHFIGILLTLVTSMFLLCLLLSTEYTFCWFWGFCVFIAIFYAYYAGEQMVCRPKLKPE